MEYSKIRFLHACSHLDIFDIYSHDDCAFCEDLMYTHYSQYSDIKHGKHKFKICPPKQKFHSILDFYLYVSEKSYQTAIITGKKTEFSFFIVPDAYIPISYTKAFIRFANLAPDSPGLDFTFVDDYSIVFEDVQYKQFTSYHPLYADTYKILVRNSETKRPLITIYDVKLQKSRFYTIYVFGFTRDNHPQYLLVADGV